MALGAVENDSAKSDCVELFLPQFFAMRWSDEGRKKCSRVVLTLLPLVEKRNRQTAETTSREHKNDKRYNRGGVLEPTVAQIRSFPAGRGRGRKTKLESQHEMGVWFECCGGREVKNSSNQDLTRSLETSE